MDHELDCRLLRIGVPCRFVEPGSNEELSRIYRLDADGIVARIEERWPR
jgi:transketolase C-terminal domain/subunit